MINVKNEFRMDDVCGSLEVERFSSTGQFVGSYCTKFCKSLPNAGAAMMYCASYGIMRACWFEIAND